MWWGVEFQSSYERRMDYSGRKVGVFSMHSEVRWLVMGICYTPGSDLISMERFSFEAGRSVR